METLLQRVLSLGNDAYMCPERVADALRLSHTCVKRWARNGFSSFGFPLRVRSAGPFHPVVIDVRDVNILTRVLCAYPLARGGPGPRDRAAEMLALAQRLRAAELKPR